MVDRSAFNRDLVATCWTWSGDSAPGRGDETSPLDMRTRVEAAAAAGWAGLGLLHADLLVARDGMGLTELGRIIRDNGITIVELEFLTDWWTTGAPRIRSDEWRRLLFDAAEALGASTMKVSGDYSDPAVAWETFAESLDQLATDSSAHGLRVAVEPMPMNNLKTLAAGMELVRHIDNPAAGLCIDTQHVARGGTAYKDIGSLIDIDKVFVVELDDSLRSPISSDLFEDAINHRLYPGKGELDVVEFVVEMARLGWSGPWGVEIISEDHRMLPLDVAVRLAHNASNSVLAQAEAILNDHTTPNNVSGRVGSEK